MITSRTFILILIFSFISAAGGYYIGSLTKPFESLPVVTEPETTIPTVDTTTLNDEEEEETTPTPTVSTPSSTPTSTTATNSASPSSAVQGLRTGPRITKPTPVKKSPSGSF